MTRLPAWFLWLLVGLWTGLIGVLLLSPADTDVVQDAHNLAGGTELTDSLGHVFLFAVLAGLLFAALAQQMPNHQAAQRAARAVLLIGLIVEVAQIWIPERGFALYDLAANWLGPALLLVYAERRAAQPRRST